MKTIKNLLARLDIDLGRISSRKKMREIISLRDCRMNRVQNTRAIGNAGALNVFTQYVLRSANANTVIDDFMRFYSKSYSMSRSQWSQDIFVMYISGQKRNGTYLEIGGADGMTHSNTIALRDELGWSGVLAEPDPSMFSDLEWSRGYSDRVIQGAASTTGHSGIADLRRVGQLSSIVGHEGKDSHYETRMAATETITVSTFDLTQLIQEMSPIDYFSLDVEGAELPILQSLRWKDIKKPGILTVEHNSRHDEISEMKKILLAEGYLEVFAEHDWVRRGDLWFVHQEYLDEGRKQHLGIGT